MDQSIIKEILWLSWLADVEFFGFSEFLIHEVTVKKGLVNSLESKVW